MTAQRDLDRLLTAWLTESAGPDERLSYLGETIDLIDRTPQRRAWPWSGLEAPRRWWPVGVPARAWGLVVVGLLLAALAVAALAGAFRQPQPIPSGPGRLVITTNGDIAVVDPDGGARVVGVTPADETMASWSPDGRRIAYWTWVIEDLPDGSQETSVPLTVVNADGSQPFVVLDGVDPPITTVEGPPQWSPDGQSLAFGAGGALYRIGTDGTGLVSLATDALYVRSAPTWSPDGAWIAFHAAPPDPPPEPRPLGSVHVIRSVGSDEAVVSGDTVVWGGNFGPAWSADSRRLAYVTPDFEVDPQFGELVFPSGIEIAILGGSGWTRAAVPGAGPLDSQVMLAWAPRSARLAYMRNNLDPTPDGIVGYQLTLIDEDGTVRPIAADPLSQGFCWAPDEQRIAAVTLDQRLVALDVATGARVDDFGVADVNVGDACTWSATAE